MTLYRGELVSHTIHLYTGIYLNGVPVSLSGISRIGIVLIKHSMLNHRVWSVPFVRTSPEHTRNLAVYLCATGNAGGVV